MSLALSNTLAATGYLTGLAAIGAYHYGEYAVNAVLIVISVLLVAIARGEEK